MEGLSGITFAGVNVGNFLTALITFVLTALALYFAVVVPYNKFSELRKSGEPEKAASSEDLLAEIRDLLRERESWRASGSGAPAVPGRLSEQTRFSSASE